MSVYFCQTGSAELKKLILDAAQRELGSSVELYFEADEIQVVAAGSVLRFKRPPAAPAQQPRFRYSSARNPFLAASGEELEAIQRKQEEWERLPPEQRPRSLLPVATKQTCEILARARSLGLADMIDLLFAEARISLAMEWPGSMMARTNEGIRISTGSKSIYWAWADLDQAAQ
mgnify:CR=1 FL=1